MSSKSPLLIMSETTPTVLWNDSADPNEIKQGLEWGVVGATCNPVIALACIKADLPRWSRRIHELAAENPTATQDEIGWLVVEELSIDAAKLLEPAFEASGGHNGRLSMQTDPRFYRNAQALADQAEHFSKLAKNIIVKIPATKVGLEAIEEATYRGVSMNVTVSFTVPQAVEAGEAIERGLKRREAEGHDVSGMGPVVTIMVGRLDDWMKDCAKAGKVSLDPGYYEWAGVAAFKKAYGIFQERGLRSRLLSAAFRNHLHWSQLIGGDVVISPPFAFQQLFNVSGIEAVARIDDPVDKAVVDALYEKIPDFRRAYDVDGMTPEEFDEFGATRKTLRQFLAAANELEAIVRDVLTPAP